MDTQQLKYTLNNIGHFAKEDEEDIVLKKQSSIKFKKIIFFA